MMNMSLQKPGFNRGSGQISINVVGKLEYPGDSMENRDPEFHKIGFYLEDVLYK